MSYIGAKELKASDIRRFDVTGSTSATHTLTWSAPTEQSLIVTINGVKQHEDAYSVFVETGNIFDKVTAKSFEKNILSKGGLKEPEILYKAFRKKLPDPKILIKSRNL